MTLGRVIHGTFMTSKHASMTPWERFAVVGCFRSRHALKNRRFAGVACHRSRMTLGRVIHGTFGALRDGRLLPVTTCPEEQTLCGGRLLPVTDDSGKSHPWHLHKEQARVNDTLGALCGGRLLPVTTCPEEQTLRGGRLSPVTDDSRKSHPWHLHKEQARVNVTGHG